MAPVPTALVGDAHTSDEAWRTLADLSDVGPRLAGHDGEAEAATYLADRFEELGFRDVAVSEVPLQAWWRESSRLSVDAGRRLDYDSDQHVVALPGSPAATVAGPLVDVGSGTAEEFAERDVTDAIAVVSSATPEEYGRWVHRTEKYGLAVEHGAAGFLFHNERPGCLPVSGYVGDDGPGAIPAVGLSREAGHRLVRECGRGAPTAELAVEARTDRSASRNVEAVLGPDADEEVLLTAHLDSHDLGTGATDNAAGCALVAEVGRLLASHDVDLDAAVRLVVFGAEEVGFRGAHRFAEAHDLDRVKCLVNVDGNGTWEDVTAYAHGFDPLASAVRGLDDAVASPLDVDDGMLPFSDHWPFVQRGVPGIMVRSESTTGRGWAHTAADTLDKLEPAPFRALSVTLAALVAAVADDGFEVPHADRDAIHRRLHEEGWAAGLQAAGDWPFDPEDVESGTDDDS